MKEQQTVGEMVNGEGHSSPSTVLQKQEKLEGVKSDAGTEPAHTTGRVVIKDRQKTNKQQINLMFAYSHTHPLKQI